MTKQQVNINYKKIKISMSYLKDKYRDVIFLFFTVLLGTMSRNNHVHYFFDHAIRIECDSFVNYLILVTPN